MGQYACSAFACGLLSMGLQERVEQWGQLVASRNAFLGLGACTLAQGETQGTGEGQPTA